MALRRPKRYSLSRRRGTGRGLGGAMFDRFGMPVPGAAGIVPPGQGGDFPNQGVPAAPPGNTGLGPLPVAPAPPPAPPQVPSAVLAPPSGGVPTPAPTPTLSPAPLVNPILAEGLSSPEVQAASTGTLDAGMIDLAAPLSTSDAAQAQVTGPTGQGTVLTGGDVGRDDWMRQTPEIITLPTTPRPAAPSASWSGSDLNPTNSSAAGTGAAVPNPMANPWSGSEGPVNVPSPTPARPAPPAPAPTPMPAVAAPISPQSSWSGSDLNPTNSSYIVPPPAPAPAPAPQVFTQSQLDQMLSAALARVGYNPAAASGGQQMVSAPATYTPPPSGPVIAPMPAVTNPVSPQSSWSGSDLNPTNSSLIAPQPTADEWIRRLTGRYGGEVVFDHGGIIDETVYGIGESGRRYVFAANGKPERVTPIKGAEAPRARNY